MAGKLVRIVGILKNAPGQIVAAKKGKSEAPAVPAPEALRERQSRSSTPPQRAKNSKRK
jgi:hypothetical protein